MRGRGGRALPKFLSTFQKLYIGSIWGWGGKGIPRPNLFGTLAFKKSGISCPNCGEGGGGVEVIWTKSKRTVTFFRETFPKLLLLLFGWKELKPHNSTLCIGPLDSHCSSVFLNNLTGFPVSHLHFAKSWTWALHPQPKEGIIKCDQQCQENMI